MNLEILSTRSGGAAENMAVDFLLLQRYPHAVAPRFRHYGWRAPAFTFGYAQKIALVREQLPAGETFDLCRRPTGGGMVDHRDDWTYALVIPRGHPLEELRATQSYRAVHEALAGTLRAQGIDAITKLTGVERVDPNELSTKPPPGRPAGVCFQRAEIYDVVDARSGEKIAGAAQKRNKHGLLFQGSIWRPAAGGAAVDWDKFEEDFVGRLAAALGAAAVPTPWPEFNEDEVGGLTEQYSAREWIECR
ncbi:MAG: lipoate--protein ligase family protein [Verrucomicrobia bacterium]|nr:lipoate--protein ligase family protein [Verrucomicrobiota bacterium]